jgi:hypothetical protein
LSKKFKDMAIVEVRINIGLTDNFIQDF